MDVKQALKDPRFRDALPIEIQDDIAKYVKNPGCPCNLSLYKKIIKNHKEHLEKYFPGAKIVTQEKEVQELSENHWSVINCHIDELESKLRKLPPGRKQVAISRYEDEVTVVVNELDVIF